MNKPTGKIRRTFHFQEQVIGNHDFSGNKHRTGMGEKLAALTNGRSSECSQINLQQVSKLPHNLLCTSYNKELQQGNQWWSQQLSTQLRTL